MQMQNCIDQESRACGVEYYFTDLRPGENGGFISELTVTTHLPLSSAEPGYSEEAFARLTEKVRHLMFRAVATKATLKKADPNVANINWV